FRRIPTTRVQAVGTVKNWSAGFIFRRSERGLDQLPTTNSQRPTTPNAQFQIESCWELEIGSGWEEVGSWELSQARRRRSSPREKARRSPRERRSFTLATV